MAISFIKQNTRKEEGMIMIYKNIKRIILSPLKQVVNVYDLGYLGVEKDFPEQLSSHYHIKRKETASYHKKKKSITKFIQKRE